MIEMPDHNRQARQHRFVVMNRQRHVHNPAWQEPGHVQLEPDHQPGHAHDDGAPQHRPVFHFLRIAEPADFRPFVAQSDKVTRHAPQIGNILFCRKQIPDQPPAFLAHQNVDEMGKSRQQQHDAGNAMNPTSHRFARTQHLRQTRIGKFQGESGHRQRDETQREHGVLPAVRQSHAQHRPPAGAQMRRDFFVKQQGVVGEHRADHDEDQRQINPPHPPVDFARQVPPFGFRGQVRVNSSAHEHFIGARMTSPAGGHEVVGVDTRVRVRRRQDQVVTMTTGAVGHDG